MGLGLVLLLSFTACKKEDTTDVTAQVALIHAAPGVVNMDVVLNNDVKVPGFFYKNVTSGTSTPYRLFTRTKDIPWNLQLKYAGAATELASAAPAWNDGGYYSVAIYDTLPSLKLLFLNDELTKPADGFAKVRFVNTLRRSASDADMTLNGSSVFTGVAYGTASGYKEIASGSGLLNVVSGSIGQLDGGGTSVNFQNGKIYTVYATGMAGSSASDYRRPTAIVVQSN